MFGDYKVIETDKSLKMLTFLIRETQISLIWDLRDFISYLVSILFIVTYCKSKVSAA